MQAGYNFDAECRPLCNSAGAAACHATSQVSRPIGLDDNIVTLTKDTN